MNPWHFRQLPLLLFLTPPPSGSTLQYLSTSSLPEMRDKGMYPWAHARSSPSWGCEDSQGARARPRSSWTPIATPSSPARLPAACWQRGRLITSRVRRECVSSVAFIFLSFSFSDH